MKTSGSTPDSGAKQLVLSMLNVFDNAENPPKRSTCSTPPKTPPKNGGSTPDSRVERQRSTGVQLFNKKSELLDHMCGSCGHWKEPNEGMFGRCSQLAIAHQRGESAMRPQRLPARGKGALQDMMSSMEEERFELVWDEAGRVVAIEEVIDFPMVDIRQVQRYGKWEEEEVRIWSPLTPGERFGCSRHALRREEDRAA